VLVEVASNHIIVIADAGGSLLIRDEQQAYVLDSSAGQYEELSLYRRCTSFKSLYTQALDTFTLVIEIQPSYICMQIDVDVLCLL